MNRTSIHEPLDAKKMIIRDFSNLLDTIPNQDDQVTIQKFLRYLQSTIRIKQVVPPVVEIMTIIKHTKPILYHAARRSIMTSSNLHMLFQLEMDLQLALDRLKQFDQ
ncbi:hypothetical protein [Brevibacillus reuszeri]|uniref:hypothetical protein n=1 Tax=Brevibacillus reuszeri TaxID=54915 RepID=UPI002896A21D|nr:hypothetical protein [Brevibacillus reuszeri]